MGGWHTPLPRPYPRRSHYPHVNMTQNQGTYHLYDTPQGTWDESPYGQDTDPFSWSNRRNNRPHWPPCSPPPHLGAPIYPQGPKLVQASIGQIASELKQVSAEVIKVEGHTKAIEQILGHLKTIEMCLSALEGGTTGVGGVQEKKLGGGSRDGANQHTALKVSHFIT